MNSGFPARAPELEDEPDEPVADFLTSQPVDGQDSAADLAAQKRKGKRIAVEQAERAAFWRGVMASQAGRAVMWEWLTTCGCFTYPSGVTPAGFPDPMAMGFRLGQQSIGKALYDMLAMLDREGVLQMHDEHDPNYIAAAKTRILR